MSKFSSISHKDWLDKIKKELRTDDLSTKNQQIDPSISINPFFERIQKASNGVRVEKKWLIKDIFDANKHTSIDIKKALEGGVNFIEIRNVESIVDPKSFFEGVFLHLIKVHLQFSKQATRQSYTKLIDFLVQQNKLNKLNVKLSSLEEQNELQDILNDKSEWYLHCFHFDFERSTVDQLSTIFNKIIVMLDGIDNIETRSTFLQNISITRSVSSNIIEEISIKLVLHYLFLQLENSFELKLNYFHTEAHCYIEHSDDQETRYIASAVRGMTACLAGYDAVYIQATSTEKVDFHNRISRNIHHLLQMESFIHKSSAAFLGSYQIENIALKISQEVWKNIGQ